MTGLSLTPLTLIELELWLSKLWEKQSYSRYCNNLNFHDFVNFRQRPFVALVLMLLSRSIIFVLDILLLWSRIEKFYLNLDIWPWITNDFQFCTYIHQFLNNLRANFFTENLNNLRANFSQKILIIFVPISTQKIIAWYLSNYKYENYESIFYMVIFWLFISKQYSLTP